MSQNKRFVESIKVENGKPQLLDFHQKRMNETLRFWGFMGEIIELESIFDRLKIPTDEVCKWRVVYNLEGNFTTEIVPYQITEIKNFQLIEAGELDYSFKYENRKMLSELKEKSTADEIIITQNGRITDTSFSNLVFLKNNEWHTPKNHLLNGVQRQFLLSQNLIKEREISTETLWEYSHFRLINAMRGWEQSNPVYPVSMIQNNLKQKKA